MPLSMPSSMLFLSMFAVVASGLRLRLEDQKYMLVVNEDYSIHGLWPQGDYNGYRDSQAVNAWCPFDGVERNANGDIENYGDALNPLFRFWDPEKVGFTQAQADKLDEDFDSYSQRPKSQRDGADGKRLSQWGYQFFKHGACDLKVFPTVKKYINTAIAARNQYQNQANQWTPRNNGREYYICFGKAHGSNDVNIHTPMSCRD
jgi:ribonuclease I